MKKVNFYVDYCVVVFFFIIFYTLLHCVLPFLSQVIIVSIMKRYSWQPKLIAEKTFKFSNRCIKFMTLRLTLKTHFQVKVGEFENFSKFSGQ